MKESERDASAAFFKSINRDQVSRAIKLGISTPEKRVFNSTFELDTNMPEWLNTERLIDHIAKINSPIVWKSILDSTPAELKNDFLLNLRLGLYDDQSIPRVISRNNNRFMISALEQGIFGAAIDKRKTSRFPIAKLTTIIADRYDGPPQNAGELLTRIQDLIPNPNSKPPQKETLFSLLLNTEAFIGISKMCPAIPLTKLMQEAWGYELDTNEEYIQSFLASIQKLPALSVAEVSLRGGTTKQSL